MKTKIIYTNLFVTGEVQMHKDKILFAYFPDAENWSKFNATGLMESTIKRNKIDTSKTVIDLTKHL